MTARPLLKWAGGKRQLLPALRRFYPADFGRYVEPFVGSGAVFFDLYNAGRLRGKEAVLIDSNADLIGCYEAVRDMPADVLRALDDLAAGHAAHGSAHYYQVRDEQRKRTTQSTQAYVASWLQCHAPAQSRIAYDYFVWVPSTFSNAFVTWGGTTDWLASVDPDVVIVERNTAEYASASGAEQAEHRAYYECLSSGKCGYEPALSQGEVVVYVRQGRAAAITARGCS